MTCKLLFLALVLVACPTTTVLAGAGCEERKPLARVLSPDRAWAATAYLNVCSDGWFVTTVTNTVEITRPGEPRLPIPSRDVVFGMDGGIGNETTALVWTNQRHLQITIPNNASIGKQDTAFADVTISYRYTPDDPVERACLKKWHALPIEEQVRRRLSPTENMAAFVAKCRPQEAK